MLIVEEEVLSDVLGRLGLALAARDADGQIVWADEKARLLLAENTKPPVLAVSALIRLGGWAEDCAQLCPAPDRASGRWGRLVLLALPEAPRALPPASGAPALVPPALASTAQDRMLAEETLFASRSGRAIRLTPREREILAAIAGGASNKEAARQLGISPRTVEVHRAHIMAKIGARNTAEMVRLALTEALYEPVP